MILSKNKLKSPQIISKYSVTNKKFKDYQGSGKSKKSKKKSSSTKYVIAVAATLGALWIATQVEHTEPNHSPTPARVNSNKLSPGSSNFVFILNQIATENKGIYHYAYISNRQRDGLKFLILKYENRLLRNPGGPLKKQAHKTEWYLIQNINKDGTYLLIPPLKYKCSDISDFVYKYSTLSDWKHICDQLNKAIIKSLTKLKENYPKKSYWIYTHGTAEPYLHIRFEPFQDKKYHV